MELLLSVADGHLLGLIPAKHALDLCTIHVLDAPPLHACALLNIELRAQKVCVR